MTTTNTRTALAFAFAAGAVVGIATIVLALATLGTGEDGWRHATRWTARVSVVLFAATWLSRGAWPARIGLAFAANHLVHAVAITVLLDGWPAPVPIVTAVGGGFAYVLIVATAVSTFHPHRFARALRTWTMRYVYLIFFLSYLGRVLEGGDRQPQGLFGLAVLATIPLMIGFRTWRTRRPAAA